MATQNRIINPASPNLPLGTEQYERRYQDQFTNILRLYFNQLRNALNELLGNTGGRFLSFPYGAFHQDGVTTLTTGITNVSTTPIVAASTIAFPPAGWILIEDEIISYTGKTATTFTGITRGVLGTTNVAHTAGKYITEVQGVASASTAGIVLFNNTDFSNGVYASTDFSKVYFENAGVYNIQFSVQFLNFTTSEDNVTLWFVQNGTAVPNSASVEQVNGKHGSEPGATIMSVNLFITANAGDHISLAWSSLTGDTAIATFPPGTSPTRPASPAVILTATFVSALPT